MTQSDKWLQVYGAEKARQTSDPAVLQQLQNRMKFEKGIVFNFFAVLKKSNRVILWIKGTNKYEFLSEIDNNTKTIIQ